MSCSYCGGARGTHSTHCIAESLTKNNVYRADKGSFRKGQRQRPTKTTAWIEHVKYTQSLHPHMSYGQAMQAAKLTYKK